VTLVAGCWKTELEELSADRVAFSPAAGFVDDWVVEAFELDIECPDGENSRFYLVYPEASDLRVDDLAAPLPLALVLHSGSFDYIKTPNPGDPLIGESLQPNVRLDAAWAIQRVFVTLGMYPNDDDVEFHSGALPTALAEAGIAMLMPANCWGDMWHNRSAVADNAYEQDLFFRNGRTAAEFAWRHATEVFPEGRPLDLPINVDLDRVYAIGLGEGGRGVTELLTSMVTDNTFATYPAAVVIDSTADDLRPYYNSPAIYAEIITGLDRIFPDGPESTQRGSLGLLARENPNALPSRIAYLYSSGDTLLPPDSHGGLSDVAAAISAEELWVYQAITPTHVLTNGYPELSDQVAAFLEGGRAAVDTTFIGGN
jgi:hypothetical protein